MNATKQRQNYHRQRKLANIRKEAARFKDGLGKVRKAQYDREFVVATLLAA